MKTTTGTERFARRAVVRIEDKIHMGGDSQVDDRYAVITPGQPAKTDPFVLLAEDWFSTTGFHWHPHRGIETVTLVVDGVLEHGDNLGNAGALATGDVQWMTAGRGIIHRELAFRNERAHILQLWLNLPGELKMVETRYQDLRAAVRPVIQRPGIRIEIISGAVEGVAGPALNQWPISGALITLEPHQTYEHVLPARDRAFFHGLSGEVTLAGHVVHAGQTAWSEPMAQAPTASVVEMVTGNGDRPSVILTYSGPPIGQPVVMGGPFIMNTRAEIERAFSDFRAGSFGRIPGIPRL